MKVLHIVETYPPDYGGGAAITTKEVCQGLARLGHEVHVLCTESAESKPYTLRTESDLGVVVHRLNLPFFRSVDPEGWTLGFRQWGRHSTRVRQTLSDLLSTWTPELVDYHTNRPIGEICLEVLAERRIPVVATLHDAWLICHRLMLLRSPMSVPCSGPGALRCLECLYSHYDDSRVMSAIKLPWRVARQGLYPAYRLFKRNRARGAVGGAIARSQFMAGVHSARINGPVRHIPLGIDMEGASLDHPERPRNPLRFGFFGGFQRVKGIQDVLLAASSLKSRGFAFELHIWGPEQDNQTVTLERLGLKDHAFLRGNYSHPDRWAAYSEIDVALMATTVCEPLGRIALEAAAAGAPTLAPAIGGIPESIEDGVNGLLYGFGDRADLENKMESLIRTPMLVRRLISNLRPVRGTRAGVADVECFYRGVLGTSTDSVSLAPAPAP